MIKKSLGEKITLAASFIALILVLLLVLFIVARADYSDSSSADALRFKQEYEALNDVLNDDRTNKYFYLSISEHNNIVYLTYEQLVDFTSNGTGLLYFGRPACPWCRLLVPHLLEYAKEAGVNIYYYDIEQDRSENNEQYQHILRIFRGYLPTDTVTQSEEEPDFNQGLKRVVLPQLFYLDNGEITFDILMFQHEYLEHDESEKIKQLLHNMHNTENCGEC
jgi:thiol-disulfide isomerase/thioredoxin